MKPETFPKSVRWSEEDKCYIGSIPGWLENCCHGSSEKEVHDKLCQILDEWIEIYRQDRKPLPL